MSEEKTATLTAILIHAKTNQEIATVEKTMAFIKESDGEQPEKTLDDIINEFIQKIRETCKEKAVSMQDIEQVYDQLAIGFALSSRLGDQKIAIEVPVNDAKEEKADEQS
ncbi:MAG: hypothetical protein NWF05_05350 [Candidatus Bathyarchaeota archaeon]|nr:hypothetical protein [Candidatus Bathyarchaeota archaeon]